MDTDSIVERVKSFLNDKHIQAEASWIREQVSALSDSQKGDAANFIYKSVLECDWKTQKVIFSQLPAGLNLLLFNEHKRTFNGKFVLQISGIVDISRAFTENKLDDEEDEDGEADNDQVSESELAKLMKGKSNTTKKVKRSWHNGKRCLEMTLFDGNKECIAMEYSPIRDLNDNLLGAKVLLSGPFDVYAGVILLRQQNIELISDVTFYPVQQSEEENIPTAIVQNVDSAPNNNQEDEENYDDLLMNDDLYMDMTL